MTGNSDQGKLYHYTTSDAFTSIIQTKQLWFTDFRFLNDSKECYFASNIVENTLKVYDFDGKREDFLRAVVNNSESNNHQYPYTYDNMTRNFKSRLKILATKEFDGMNPFTSIPYIFSLSAEKDSLSQWRAYGKGELCIEFDPDKLIQIMGGSLLEVRYEKSDAVDDNLTHAIDEFLKHKLDLTRGSGHLHPEVVHMGTNDLRGFLLRDLIPIRIKHEGFKGEREWRLVRDISPGIWRVAPDNAPDGRGRIQCFFDRGRYSIPRAKILISDDIKKVPDYPACSAAGSMGQTMNEDRYRGGLRRWRGTGCSSKKG